MGNNQMMSDKDFLDMAEILVITKCVKNLDYTEVREGQIQNTC